MFELREGEGGEMAVVPSLHLGIDSPRMKVAWRDRGDGQSRLVKIRMSYSVLAVFLRAHVNHDYVGTNAPKDLEVVDVYNESRLFYKGDYFWVTCRSVQFDPVPEGQMIPEREFMYWRTDDAEPIVTPEDGR